MRNGIMVAVALLTLAAVAGAQETTSTRQPLTGFIVHPCTGEPLVYNGTCHYVTHANGTITNVHANCKADAIGVFGNEYAFGLSSQHRSDTMTCNASERFSETTRIISARSAQNAFITVKFLVTTDENCQPVVVVDETEADCRGKSPVF